MNLPVLVSIGLVVLLAWLLYKNARQRIVGPGEVLREIRSGKVIFVTTELGPHWITKGAKGLVLGRLDYSPTFRFRQGFELTDGCALVAIGVTLQFDLHEALTIYFDPNAIDDNGEWKVISDVEHRLKTVAATIKQSYLDEGASLATLSNNIRVIQVQLSQKLDGLAGVTEHFPVNCEIESFEKYGD